MAAYTSKNITSHAPKEDRSTTENEHNQFPLKMFRITGTRLCRHA